MKNWEMAGRRDKNEKLGNGLHLSLLLWKSDLILCLNKRFAQLCFNNKKKLYGPFLWMGFNCLKATGPLRGDSLLTRSPGVRGSHLIDLTRMKG